MIKPKMRFSRLFSVWALTALLTLSAQPHSAGSKDQEPSFPFYDRIIDGLDGQKAALAKWRGKVIIANFWASWCAPCQYEIPRLKAWQHKHGEQGLQVVGIGLDSREKLKNVVRSLEIGYPTLVMSLDNGRPILSKHGNSEMIIPFTLIIDRDGSIVYRHKGLIGQDEFDIMIAPLL